MIRVIGLGSPFGDDQAGWRVVELLRGQLPDSIELITLDRPGASLINWMQQVRHLVLIDACRGGASPGSLFRLRPQDLQEEQGRFSSHDLTLQDTLQLAGSLGSVPETLEIHAIEIGHLAGESMSPVVEKATRALAARIVDELCATTSGRPPTTTRD